MSGRKRRRSINRTSINDYMLMLETMSPQERIAHIEKQKQRRSQREIDKEVKKVTKAENLAKQGDGGWRARNPRLVKLREKYKEWEKEHRVVAPCPACGNEAMLTKDHIIPRAKGGSNKRENIQWICEPCNHEKSDSSNWVPPIMRVQLDTDPTDVLSLVSSQRHASKGSNA